LATLHVFLTPQEKSIASLVALLMVFATETRRAALVDRLTVEATIRDRAIRRCISLSVAAGSQVR
jgi:hypothetical protein